MQSQLVSLKYTVLPSCEVWQLQLGRVSPYCQNMSAAMPLVASAACCHGFSLAQLLSPPSVAKDWLASETPRLDSYEYKNSCV